MTHTVDMHTFTLSDSNVTQGIVKFNSNLTTQKLSLTTVNQ